MRKEKDAKRAVDAVLEALDKIAKALHGTSMDKLLARGA